ncbi:hypothetical protein NIES4074_64910 (plasmid) [Cylindrospermum sp. NIES-4074]|nr:hypothetical protein NIES4074_64910 [Cylindrospermum sp. NIES-4074]
MQTMTHLTTYRRILHWSLATSATFGIIASLPSKVMALTGFTGPYDPSNWSTPVINSNANGSVDTANAPSEITLTGGDNNSNLPGTTDWTIFIDSSRAGNLSFDWSYFLLDTEAQDTAGYLLNGAFTTLAIKNGESSSSPVTLLVNPGDTFGFRVATLDNGSGTGIFSVSNFNVQPVPFEFSPAVGLAILGLNGVYRLWRKQQIQILK